MSSPFKGFENATLIFDSAGNDTTEDEFGNAIASSQNVKITACMERKIGNERIKISRIEGISESAWWLQGNCVTPMILPKVVSQGDWAECIFSGIDGWFYLSAINPPYGREGIGAIEAAAAGTLLQGWFQQERI